MCVFLHKVRLGKAEFFRVLYMLSVCYFYPFSSLFFSTQMLDLVKMKFLELLTCLVCVIFTPFHLFSSVHNVRLGKAEIFTVIESFDTELCCVMLCCVLFYLSKVFLCVVLCFI